jgi:hypothetical protein
VTFFIGRCRSTRTLSLRDRPGGLRIQRSHRRAPTPKARRKKTSTARPRPRYRELTKERTDEGRIRAKARGVRFGRPHKLTSHQRREILDRLAAGEIQADLARTYNVGEATISRLAARGPFERSAAAV